MNDPSEEEKLNFLRGPLDMSGLIQTSATSRGHCQLSEDVHNVLFGFSFLL